MSNNKYIVHDNRKYNNTDDSQNNINKRTHLYLRLNDTLLIY